MYVLKCTRDHNGMYLNEMLPAAKQTLTTCKGGY